MTSYVNSENQRLSRIKLQRKVSEGKQIRFNSKGFRVIEGLISRFVLQVGAIRETVISSYWGSTVNYIFNI